RHTRSTRDWSSDVCSSDLVRHGDDDITTADPCRYQRESQRIGAAAHSNAIFCAAELREFALELFQHSSADKHAGSEYAFHSIHQFLFELDMRSDQRQERNSFSSRHPVSPLS